MSADNFDNKVFVINKQRGPTSFQVVHAFRKAARVDKAGHAGTLDPLAEGVLVLCTGRATKAVEHFMNLPKVYEFDVRLGVETDTLDAEGVVVDEAPCPDIPIESLRRTAESFLGTYHLDPPAFSALKKNGRRFYQLARAGESPRPESRQVTIHEIDVTGVSLPDVRCRIKCSRGTYVRSLAKDFGRRLDLPAHIRNLVRTAVGPFRIEDAYPAQRLFEGEVSGLNGRKLVEALEFLPGIVIGESSRRALLKGVVPGRTDVIETIGEVSAAAPLRILDETGELLAIGRRSAAADRARTTWFDSYRLFVDVRS